MKGGNYKKKENGNSNAKKSINSTKESNGASTFHESADTTKQFTDRFDYLLSESVGADVVVTTTSGVQYEGILSACNLESTDGVDVVLKHPKMVSTLTDDKQKLSENIGDTFLINGDDVAELELKDIKLSLDEKVETAKKQPQQPVKEAVEKLQPEPVRATTPSSNRFRTDVDISGAKNIKERELTKWTPDEDAEALGNSQTLEEASSTWDQFSVNEKKFGITSTYDEHFYTTKINKNDPNYSQRLREADRLANEIEGQGSSGNVHLAEDRGIVIDDSGLDEEDLYSGVDRGVDTRGDELLASLKTNSKPNVATKSNKYVPPTLRNQPHHTDPAIISSSTSKTNTTPVVIEATTRTKEAKDESKAQEKPKAKTQLKDIGTDLKEQLKEIKRQAGRRDHDSTKSKHIPTSKSSKEAQIEELKNFSQKFKVPYEVPKDIDDVLRRPSNSLKSDPSLPPKPKSSGANSSSTKNGSKVTTSTQGKGEPKKANGSQTPIVHSPSANKTNMHPRRRQTGSFFGSKKPQANANKGELFSKNFNFFLRTKEAHDEEKSMEPFLIEKPYFAAPTWTGTADKSFKSLLPDQQTVIQKSQVKLQMRQMQSMGGMNASGMVPVMGPGMGSNGMGMMGFPMTTGGPSGSSTSPQPMMNGYSANSMGMYMPFQPQPMYYPSMGPMVPMMGKDNGPSPSPTGGPPAYMNVGTPYGYPGMVQFPGMMNNNMVGGASGNNIQGYNGKQGYHGNNNSQGHNNNNGQLHGKNSNNRT